MKYEKAEELNGPVVEPGRKLNTTRQFKRMIFVYFLSFLNR